MNLFLDVKNHFIVMLEIAIIHQDQRFPLFDNIKVVKVPGSI